MPYTHAGPALWLNADKSKVVEEGSPDAAFLLVADGGTLADDEAAQYDLTNDDPKAKADAPANKAKADAPATKAKG